MTTRRWVEREVVEEFAVVGGLIALQFVYAANTLLLSYFMSLGLKPLTIVIYSTSAAFLILSPLSILFERSKWPQKFSVKLSIQLVLIAFGGVTLFQTLMLKGIELTSPAIATAMPNLAPGIIFLIAAVLGFEKVELSCRYSKVKIAGTLLCVVGAIAMSILQGTNQPPSSKAEETNLQFSPQKIVGCAYLMAAVFVLSCNMLLQASALAEFPAPMSMFSITSVIGVVISATVEFIKDRKLDFGWSTVGFGSLLCYSLLGGLVGGVMVSFNGWALQKRGPVLVSMFSPIATVVSVIISCFTVGGLLSLGSLGGMLLMFTGLYLFLWAKGKEGFSIGESEEYDVEKRLLS
ncbi:WAT1-related protein At5g47470 [Diospyros lotus]|uniref:WAT1-related protein At5g47470 n=1 Tax=Diospyros lotus TaxID=55363 RepID=UPI0022542A73|nr:WAT1-related protein At5g47470 [Diospyros lotus]